MPFYTYKGREANGKTISGLVEAPSADAATKLLHEKQLFIISMTQSKGNSSTGRTESIFQRVPFNDIVNFTRQLSTMITAGLSLPESLSILKSQTTNKTFQTVSTDVEHQIVSGGNLGDSLAKYPQHFSP